MADPRLKTIRDAIVTRLGTILIASGFNYNIGSYGVDRPSVDTITNFPAVYVGRTTIVQREAVAVGDTSRNHQATARFELRLFHETTDPHTEELLLWYDVVKAIESDPLLLGLASLTVSRAVVGQIEDLNAETDTTKPIHQWTVTVEVDYRMARAQL